MTNAFCAFTQVADDECRHFLLLEQRLKDLGSSYGALPVHDGWVAGLAVLCPCYNLATRGITIPSHLRGPSSGA
jgi:hypothetical protein